MTDLSNYANEINDHHNRAFQYLGDALKEAIEAGHLLTTVEESLLHGQFETWVKENCKFGLTQAWRYRNYYQYRINLRTCEDLQAADKKVHELKSEEKKQERERNQKLIAQYEETGERGEGWTRTTDYELKKKQEDIIALSEANQDVEINEGQAIINEEYEKDQKQQESNNRDEQWQKIIDMLISAPVVKNDDLQLADLKANVRQNGIFKVVEDYVKSFPDVNRHLEAVHNLMKSLHRLGVELQPKTQEKKRLSDFEIEKAIESVAI